MLPGQMKPKFAIAHNLSKQYGSCWFPFPKTACSLGLGLQLLVWAALQLQIWACDTIPPVSPSSPVSTFQLTQNSTHAVHTAISTCPAAPTLHTPAASVQPCRFGIAGAGRMPTPVLFCAVLRHAQPPACVELASKVRTQSKGCEGLACSVPHTACAALQAVHSLLAWWGC